MPDGDAWRLYGLKWFASNAGAPAFVVLARPRGAVDGIRGVAPFLVLRERRDGTPNAVTIRRLKEKLGTRSVASGEVELHGAEAFRLGAGLGPLMELTNRARLTIATMGLGCARRALVEALSYAGAREAFGAPLRDQPLMRRKLAELIVEVEAAQLLVFDGHLGPPLRLGPALAKLRCARLGVTAASDAIEVHGGNGYIEQWPVARILRDAQVNPIWEGGDNILCLDVRRAMAREGAHEPFLARLAAAVDQAPPGDPTTTLVRERIADLTDAIAAWTALSPADAEARLFPLAGFMCDVYAAALLLEHAGWQHRAAATDRGALVARLYARAHLADPGRLRGIDRPAEELARFNELVAGAL